MGNDKHLKLRAASKSGLGRTIAYLQNGSNNQQELASTTLQSRFLPFAMDRSDPEFLSVSIRCATDCEAWARAIREYADLEVIPTLSSAVRGLDEEITHDSLDEGDEVDGSEEEDEEVEVESVDDLGF